MNFLDILDRYASNRPGDHPHEARDDFDQVARQAPPEKDNPGVIERVSRFYARHPELVRNLGAAALSIAMRKMARRARH